MIYSCRKLAGYGWSVIINYLVVEKYEDRIDVYRVDCVSDIIRCSETIDKFEKIKSHKKFREEVIKECNGKCDSYTHADSKDYIGFNRCYFENVIKSGWLNGSSKGYYDNKRD